jgi:alpha-tubulin suppressor-like RCC1 family protein
MATTTNLGKLRPDYRGDWTIGTAYVINDVVLYRGSQYICTANATAGIAPSNASYWTSLASFFNNRGTWASGLNYLPGDVVVYNTPGAISPTNANFTLTRSVNQAYYCITSHTSSGTITPIDTGYWYPVNRKTVLGTQTSSGATTGAYTLGVYSNSNYGALIFPNRGIAFDSQSNYRGGGYKNTTDSLSFAMVSTNGQVVTAGTDSNGSLGFPNYTYLNHQNSLTFPFYDWYRSTSNSGTGVHSTPDNNVPRVIQYEKSYSGNLVLMNSGEVFHWGYGGNSENGNGSTSNLGYAVRVGGTQTSVYNNTPWVAFTNGSGGGHAFRDVRIKRIAMSGGCGTPDDVHHCLALDENGFVWAWGYNGYGQLGTNNTTNYNIPQRIDKSNFNNQNVIAIWALGNRTGWSMAVTADNNLYVWGYNGQGQLGVSDALNRQLPTLVTTVSFGSVGVGTVVKVQGLDRWNGSAGEGCTAILTSRGYIYTTGTNNSGWMGNSNTTALNTWTNMGSGPGTTSSGTAYDMWLYGAGGNRATILIRDTTTAGTCWTCGYNSRGQLGIGGTSTTQSTTVAKTKIAIAGSLYDLTNVKQLGFMSSDDALTAAVVLDNGISFSIGDNSYGQTSNGTTGTYGGGFADSSGIENINSYAWQPVRAAPGMVGRFDDVIGFQNAGQYHMMWKNLDGRVMAAGYANDHVFGYSPAVDAAHAMIMTVVPTN